MAIHEECGVFGILSRKENVLGNWFIMDSMHFSTEGRKAAALL